MATFDTPEPITATLTTAGAKVRVTASERTDTVVRVEPIDNANKSDVKVAEKTEVDFSGGELSVRTTKSGDKVGSVAIAIDLPVGSRLDLHTAWTDVRADGQFGDCALHVASGQVRLDRIAALKANLAAGEVAIGHVAGTADIEGGAAGVRLGEVQGAVRYEGANGKVRIGHALSNLDLNGANGSFDIDDAENGVTAKAANCPIRIGRITRGQVNLTNASGGIEIGIGEGSTASVDAESTKGNVRNSLPARENPGDDEVKVYARTRRDDIVIRRAAR